MPSLSSLIVQRQVASIAEVEQAIARQVIHGGDLVTNLLEVSPQCEQSLTRVLAESLGIPSIPPGRLPAPDNDVLDIVPVETALRYGIFPLRLASKTLVIATSERLKPTALHDLAYALGLDLSQVAAPLIRIREGIAAHYGVPLEPRQLRLVQRLDAAMEGAVTAHTRPHAAAGLPTSPSILPSKLSSGVSSPPPVPESDIPTTRRKGSTLEMEASLGEGPRHPDAPESTSLLEPAPDAHPAREPVAFSEEEPPPEEQAPASFVSAPPPEVVEESPPTRASGAPLRFEDAPPLETTTSASFPAADSPRPPGMVDRRAVANLLKREVGARRKTVARSARKKGPYARVDAERDVEAARSPEEICDVFFAFGSQFFEYGALFVIHGDIVEGRDAWGPGADHLRVLGLGVPLDLPSSLSIVRKEGHVLLSRFDELDLDRELIRDLERSRARPPIGAIVPLTIKGRAVAMLYGDDGESDVTLGSLGDLLAFSAFASAQLERVALNRKKKGRFDGLVAPRVQPSSVEALARAFSLPMPHGAIGLSHVDGSSHATETRVSPGATTVNPPRPITSTYGGPRHNTLEAPGGIDLALAQTAVPSFSAEELAVAADTRAAETPLAPEALEPAHAPTLAGAAVSPAAPHEEASPRPPAALAAPELEHVLARAAAPSEAPPPVTLGRVESARPSGRFVPPIPRVDDDDASSLVAEHVGDGFEASSPRSEVEPSSVDGRIGSYQLVPRPVEARNRDEPADLSLLLERSASGGLEGEEALSELLRRAELDFPLLMDRFPGPLVVDRLRARADLPAASECGPLLKVVVMMRRASLPFMTVKSASADVEQRFWATHVLGELLLPEASNAILPRLFDEDVSVRRVARRAAQTLAAAGAPGEPLKHSLGHTMRSSEEAMQRRLLAIEALSDIRVPSVVPLLIAALYDPSDAIVEAARTALMIVSRQDLGRNPQVWTAWWELHQHENRVVWLIQSLTHETPSIRRAAADELKALTREYFGYYDDLPPRERERAQARYLQWWSDEGQYRFR